MMSKLSAFILATSLWTLSIPVTSSFGIPACHLHLIGKPTPSCTVLSMSTGLSTESTTTTTTTTRRQLLLQSSKVAIGVAAAATVLFLPLQPSMADVADGSALPQGAAQFSRIVRLKVDLVAVEKRVSEKSSEIDSKEWDDLGQFLRRIYATGDDMKVIASGIFDPDQKKRAEEAISLLKRYAQAGDIAINKRDPDGFVLVIQKLKSQVEDFLDSLRDVPDEI